MSTSTIKTDVGKYMVVYIKGSSLVYIAEVVQSNPLIVKIQDEGPYAELKYDDINISTFATESLQEGLYGFLRFLRRAGRKIYSGLSSLGIEDGEIQEISARD